MQMRRMLPESVLEEVGGLDQAAIAQVREEAWPDVRDADELHDVLHTLVVLPAVRASLDRTAPSSPLRAGEGGSPQMSGTGNDWLGYFQSLVNEGRAASAVSNGRIYWVAAERQKTFSVLFPEARFEPGLAEVEASVPGRDDALLTLVTGWMSHLGPTTAAELGETLGISAAEILGGLLRMEASGTVLRGNFSGSTAELRSATGQPRASAVPTECPCCRLTNSCSPHRSL